MLNLSKQSMMTCYIDFIDLNKHISIAMAIDAYLINIEILISSIGWDFAKN